MTEVAGFFTFTRSIEPWVVEAWTLKSQLAIELPFGKLVSTAYVPSPPGAYVSDVGSSQTATGKNGVCVYLVWRSIAEPSADGSMSLPSTISPPRNQL